MKTPEQYIPDTMPCADVWRGIVREIQFDTLNHAAEIADGYKCKILNRDDVVGKTNNAACDCIAKSIRAAAMPNHKLLPDGLAHHHD
jgi:hypothetical protein